MKQYWTLTSMAVCLAFVACTVRGADGKLLGWDDDFSKPGTTAAPVPGWEADAFVWQVRNGVLEASWLQSAFAFPPQQKVYRKLTAEVVVIPRKAHGKSWKIAALAVVQDSGNFWHLGLVEKPDEVGAGHYVELCEMRDGHWLAQQKLKNTSSRGNDAAWKYGQRYRLRIALTPSGITGTVSTPDGKELTRIAYAFTAPAVTLVRPALRVIAMDSGFDDFHMEADPATGKAIPKPAEKTFPAYAVKGSGIPAPGGGTGFFRTVRVVDRWWLVDPRGELFYAVGTDHVNYYSHWCQKLGYAPYNRFCEKKYGSVEKWAESATERLRAWGFNLLGAGNIPPVRYQGLAHTVFAAFGSSFSDYSTLVEKVHWTGFPNVFDERWEVYCDSKAKKLCAPNRNDPWLLGYFLDNELEWWGKSHTADGIFIDTMKRPPDHSGKRALVDFLRKRHGDIAAFNRVWKQKARTWDDVLKMTRLPAPGDSAKAIQHEFLAVVADRYFSVAARAIRKVDPNHLIIGSRFAGNAPDEAWQACAKYCDVVTFNNYPRIDFDSGDLSDLAKVFEHYFSLTARPMMITEWSFPALDAGLPCKHGAGMRVDTQEQKARCFTLMQHLLFRLPFMVGSDYFMWADEPAQGISDTFPEDSNYGLVNVEDKPYTELTNACRRLNPLAVPLHRGEVPETYIRTIEARNGQLRVTVENLAVTTAMPRIEIQVGKKTFATGTKVAGGGTAVVTARAKLGPGGHTVQVRLDRDPRTPIGCRGTTKRLTTVFRPGVAWPPASGGIRRYVSILNSGADPRPACPVFLPHALPGTPPNGAAEWLSQADERGTAVPAVLLDDGTVALRVPTVPAYSGLAGLLYGNSAGKTRAVPGQSRIKVRSLGRTGFQLDNGLLTLQNQGKAGNVVDRISVKGMPLGLYNPLVWQDPGQNQWVRTSQVEQVRIRQSSGADGGVVVVDVVTVGGEAARTLTAVNAEGKAAARQASPVRFRVAHRLILWPSEPWFACRALWIENADSTRTLTVKGVFYYLLSGIGGDSKGDRPGSRLWPEVPNYYRNSGTGFWQDAEAKAYFGAVPLSAESRIRVRFWLDEGGGQHPDARFELKPAVVLRPGERKVLPDDDWLLVFGARDAAAGTPESWAHVRGLLSAAPKTVAQLGPVEKRR